MQEDIILPNNSAYFVKGANRPLEIDCPEIKNAGIIIFPHEMAQSPTSHNEALAKICSKNKLAALIPASLNAAPVEADVFAQAEQLQYAALWARKHPCMAGLSIGYFGTGAAAEAALVAAARAPDLVQAVVVRGNRPDAFASVLPAIKAPVLLIAPGRNLNSVRSNQAALSKLNGDSAINIISSASASFQEPGVMEESAQLASLWFLQHMV
jgi:putative phosphoribosyl transferase